MTFLMMSLFLFPSFSTLIFRIRVFNSFTSPFFESVKYDEEDAEEEEGEEGGGFEPVM